MSVGKKETAASWWAFYCYLPAKVAIVEIVWGRFCVLRVLLSERFGEILVLPFRETVIQDYQYGP